MIESYLREIKKIYEKEDTREESFYIILGDFLSSFSKKYLNFDIDVRILSFEFPLKSFNYPICLLLLGFVRNPSQYPLLNAIRKRSRRGDSSPTIV